MLWLLLACSDLPLNEGDPGHEVDFDDDGFAVEDDCDDEDADVHPDATEVCNDVDDDCDLEIDEGLRATFFRDSDADGFGDEVTSEEACAAPTGFVTDATDCDDTDAAVHPGAAEICDTLDQDEDCDGAADDLDPEGATGASEYFPDGDLDGYGDETAKGVTVCDRPTDWVTDATDCLDSDAAIHPAAVEVCDSMDNDCDGLEKVCDTLPDISLDTADVSLEGPADSRFGWNVTGLGDLDGDGVGDFGGSSNVWTSAWIVHGPLSTASGAIEDFATGTVTGPERVGYSMAGTGDIDGDGLDDVLVGAPRNGARAFVATGPAIGTVAMDDADIVWEGDKAAWLGVSVDGGFDANGDGNADYVIGDPSAGPPVGGVAYLVYGPTTAGQYVIEDDADAQFAGRLNLGLGQTVVGVDDMDGDGFDELVLGDWVEDEGDGEFLLFLGGDLEGAFEAKTADVVFEATRDDGHASADAGDTNGDGYGDLWITEIGPWGAAYLFLGPTTAGGILSAVADAVLEGEDEDDLLGLDVAGRADLNLDSYADALVGSRDTVPFTSAFGATYVLLGPMSGAIPLGDARCKIVGTDPEEIAGYSVAFIGDQDGDGLPEALIGATYYNAYAGRAAMVLGNRL